MILNSTVNSVIYCCFNTKFRKQVSRFRSTVTRKFTIKATNQEIDEDKNCEDPMELNTIKA